MISALIFIFLGFPTGSMLNACNKQIISSLNLGIVMVVSIVMNLLLIPRFDVLGATVTAFATNVLLALLGFYWVEKIVEYNKKFLWLSFFRIMLAGVIMGGFIYACRERIHFLLLAIVGAIIYFIMLYLLRGYTKKDVVNIWSSVMKR
jgi:O-antigen/teichoic acid export membrane protein